MVNGKCTQYSFATQHTTDVRIPIMSAMWIIAVGPYKLGLIRYAVEWYRYPAPAIPKIFVHSYYRVSHTMLLFIYFCIDYIDYIKIKFIFAIFNFFSGLLLIQMYKWYYIWT